MDKVANEIYDELIDMSNLTISSHALSQYSLKCYPNLGILEITKQIREKLKKLKEINVNENKLKKHPNSKYYMDEDEIVYVVANNKIVTTYPNKRIFKSKPLLSIKKTGWKWL